MTHWHIALTFQDTNVKMGNIFTCKEPNVSLPKDDNKLDSRERNLKTARYEYQLEQKTHMFLDVEQRSMDDVILNLPPMVSG